MELTAVSQTSTNKALPLVVTDAKAFKCNVPGVSGKLTLTESKRAILPINNLYLLSLVQGIYIPGLTRPLPLSTPSNKTALAQCTDFSIFALALLTTSSTIT